jgi:two-component system, NtrC family, C4-dicarboxylate transport sensor histidine kinase DctB
MAQDAIAAGPARRPPRLQAGLAVLGLLLVLAVGLVAHAQARRVFLDDTARRGDTTLRLTVSTLNAQLDRFQRLPWLAADQPIVRALAASPGDPARVAAANLYLRHLAVTLGASDVYYMDGQGYTLAASNFDQPTSFVGGNFAFRPYFTDALAGGEGRFFALGTTSGKRGYYVGAPVRVNDTIAGVMVVKIDLDAIEDTWRGGDDEIVVTDPEDMIFLSSRADWLYRPYVAPDAEDRARTVGTRRYANLPLDDPPLLTGLPDAQGLAALSAGATMLALSERMPEAGWKVTVLLDIALAKRQAVTLAIAVALAVGLLLMGAAALWERRARLADRLAVQAAARAELERRVIERTAELAAVNDRLGAEVAERRAAEDRLRQAQADLIQAAKLAALGQMSAALSHEFNQPLAAVRTYAENLPALLDRGRTAEARHNAERILGLIDRMAALARDLRNFARRPETGTRRASLPEVIRAATEIAGPRLRAAGAELIVEVAPDTPAVAGGPLRLEQVLVNIITNAADAVDGLPDRRILLSAAPHARGRAHHGARLRPRRARGAARPHLRPVLLDQGRGPRAGAGAVHLLQHRQGLRRRAHGRGARGRRGRVPHRPARRRRAGDAGGVTGAASFLSTTSPTCGPRPRRRSTSKASRCRNWPRRAACSTS